MAVPLMIVRKQLRRKRERVRHACGWGCADRPVQRRVERWDWNVVIED